MSSSARADEEIIYLLLHVYRYAKLSIALLDVKCGQNQIYCSVSLKYNFCVSYANGESLRSASEQYSKIVTRLLFKIVKSRVAVIRF